VRAYLLGITYNMHQGFSSTNPHCNSGQCKGSPTRVAKPERFRLDLVLFDWPHVQNINGNVYK